MADDQNRAKSAGKIKQLVEVMKSLNIKAEARQRVGRDGYLELVVVFIDLEKYQEEKPLEQGSEDMDSEIVPPFSPIVDPGINPNA